MSDASSYHRSKFGGRLPVEYLQVAPPPLELEELEEERPLELEPELEPEQGQVPALTARSSRGRL